MKKLIKILIIIAISVIVLFNVYMVLWVGCQLAFRDVGPESSAIITPINEETVLEIGQHYTAEDLFEIQGINEESTIEIYARWIGVSDDVMREGIVHDEDGHGFVVESGTGDLSICVRVTNPGEKYSSAYINAVVNSE